MFLIMTGRAFHSRGLATEKARLMCEQLGVVCIEVMAYVEAVNRICHIFCIDCEPL